jgi:hypothetical protein
MINSRTVRSKPDHSGSKPGVQTRHCQAPRATAEQIGTEAQFANGSGLDADLAALVLTTAIGRMLSPKETFETIEQLARGIPKRTAARTG